MSIDDRLTQLGLSLPPIPKPAGVYKPAVTVDRCVYLSGHGPLLDDGTLIKGRLGDDLDVDAGKHAARQTGLAMLATLKAHLGSLDRVERVVKILGMVQCTPGFGQQPAVINGCSELFREVFGEELGVGARSAVGFSALPGGMAIEIEAIFSLKR